MATEDCVFQFDGTVTAEHKACIDEHGYLVFRGAVESREVEQVLLELSDIERRWLHEGRDEVNGIPIFRGKNPEGEPFIQRFTFTSCFSDFIHELVRDERFNEVRQLIGKNTRVGDREKDGVVVNRYVNAPGSVHWRLGWHTDGLRDLFYLRMPKKMLNIGLHLDRNKREDGGLRLIPGTHKQDFLKMLLHKPYFVSHGIDADEVAVETEPGDLTIHDGRLWHRVEASPHPGWRSLRRTMYVPYLTDDYQPKHESSRTPLYHHVGRLMRKLGAQRRVPV
jgi:ectoine hydroxylase-related dioxygenase (phytanoyl-CoA dioxygenase family)